MNKVVIGLVAGLAVAAGAPALCGWAIEHGSPERLKNALDLVPYLSVHDRTFHRGWLSSEEVITFELLKDFPGAPARGADAPPRKPRLFTVRNVIHHGPLPGFSSIALAVIDTHTEPTPGAEPLPKLPAAVHGTVTTTLNFLGGGRTVVSNPAFPETDLSEGWRLASDKSEIDLDFGSHFDTLDLTWTMPHFLAKKEGALTAEMSGWKMQMKSHRIVRSLYASDADWTVGSFEFTDLKAANPKLAGVGFRAAHYVATTSAAGGFLNGSGTLTAREAHAAGQFVQSLKFDVGLEHWQADALEKLMDGLRKFKPDEGAATPDKALESLKPLKAPGITLLVNDPVMRIKTLEVATQQGFAQLSASFRITGATAADFDPTVNVQSLVQKVGMEAEIIVDDEIADFIDRPRSPPPPGAKPPAPSPLAGLIAQGFVTREKGKTRTKIAFTKGQFTMNGKPFSPAALAPPPPPPGPPARPGKPVHPRPATAGA